MFSMTTSSVSGAAEKELFLNWVAEIDIHLPSILRRQERLAGTVGSHKEVGGNQDKRLLVGNN